MKDYEFTKVDMLALEAGLEVPIVFMMESVRRNIETGTTELSGTRQTGKTTRLLLEAIVAAREGSVVNVVCSFSPNRCMRQAEKLLKSLNEPFRSRFSILYLPNSSGRIVFSSLYGDNRGAAGLTLVDVK